MGKHSKKSKKAKKQKSSSSSDEWVEAELVERSKKRHKYSSEESFTEEAIISRKLKYENSHSSSNKSGKKKSKRNYSSSSESSDEPASRRRRRSKSPSNKSSGSISGDNEEPILNKREDWMDMSTSFSSFSNVDRKTQKEREKKQQKEAEQYNPSKCPRELNPYWKDGGDGLPKFQKPKDNDSDDDSYRHKDRLSVNTKPQSNWRKPKLDKPNTSSSTTTNKLDFIKSKDYEASNIKEVQVTTKQRENAEERPITEKELNLIAGKLIKAEIMGNEKLVKELKEKLENGKQALAEAKLQDDTVLLTQTDRQGHSKPLSLQSHYDKTSSNKKQCKKVLDTHKDKQRVRYFPDDDKYSLKQMFENEKFNSGNDQDSEFMKIASKIRKNDDLDDLFADNVRRKKSDAKIDEAKHSKAVSEHKKVSDSLNICSKCIQSNSMQKHLIVSLGEYVYLSIPAHEPLLEGHCLIVPIRHVASVTLLDENEWNEIRDFRKALVRMFAAKNEEPVFFEIAAGFHRYPHMVLECVPLPKEEGEMAPIYFKKAIDESETEWAQNKKLVSLKGRDVRRAIPKGLPYFAVSFGMEEGFAHVIEDEKLFPKNFAQEIIGGMLDLNHSKWRKPSRQSFDVQSKRVLGFSNQWKDFDCTVHT